jgi:hypothetical protein
MQSTKQQLAYQQHVVRVRKLAHGVMRRHNRHDAVTLDGGRMEMLPDDAAHSLRIPTGPANVDVVIAANWFLDPDRYRAFVQLPVCYCLNGRVGSTGTTRQCPANAKRPDKMELKLSVKRHEISSDCAEPFETQSIRMQ